jgi:tRNA(Ile)-lysidine synthase
VIDEAQWPGAVAVSGGGDSMAMMLLLADWAAAEGRAPPVALIVDHGLRAGSAKDAKKAARWAREAGLKSHVLTWEGRKPRADIEAAAREARYRLMGQWCSDHGVGFLYLAHTIEDQAETFLLRLARGSGVDGLSAMGRLSPFPGFERLRLVRPLLGIQRADLRAVLTARGQKWLEDPMNDDPHFARVQMRRAAGDLALLGLSVQRLAAAAGHLGRAREALEQVTQSWLGEASQLEPQRALIDGRAFAAVPEEIGLRALADLLMRMSGQAYRPRFERLVALYGAIRSGKFAGRTLHGCRIGRAAKRDAIFGPETLTIVREPGRSARRDSATRALP